MRDDDPADAVHDLFGEALFGDTPLGRPVIGSVRTIESLSRDRIAGYYRRRYRPDAMVVAAAGRLEHGAVVRRVRKAFASRLDPDAAPRSPRAGTRAGRAPARQVAVIGRPTEQAHLVLGGTGLARTDERRFALGVLNNALGGGMSSRLFQEIREKRGLAYSVYSFSSQHADAGQFGVAVGCHPGKVPEVLAIVREQLAEVAAHGITAAEVARGKGQVRGGLVLGLEDIGLPDEPDRQGRAGVRRGPLGRRAAGPGRRGHPRGGPRGGRGRAAAAAVPRRGRAVRRVRLRRCPGLIALPPILVEPTHREVPRRSQRQDRRRRGCRRVPA